MEKEAVTLYKRYEKRIVGHLALGLILYLLITTAVVLADYGVRIGLLLLARTLGWETQSFSSLATSFSDSYWSMILGALLGVFFLKFWMQQSIPMPALFFERKKMEPAVLVSFLCVFAAGQLLFTGFSYLLEFCLNLIGLSSASAIEQATGVMTEPSMILYAAVLAPVTEEIIFRGYCLRCAQQFGRNFAIIFSAALFAIMHANVPQAFFAFYVGIILGVITTEYSIKYAILFHLINNFAFGELLELMLSGLPDRLHEISFYLLFGMFAFCAVVVIILYRRQIVRYIRSGHSIRHTYLYAFSALPVVIFILLCLVPALMMLDKI
ncbi:MAG: CPBP family intramembrane metalloprotease [Lachnospiraceae bacterium]|nr:CPBP family intramembrane metalloprotease [Lachnospiraceae bacterium]